VSPRGSVGTLARGLDVLELFATRGPELTQKEISDGLGLPIATVHRLCRLLTERGYLEREPHGHRLRLGLAVARLAPALLSGLRLPDAARSALRGLAAETGETVNLAVLHEREVVYLLSESGTNLLTPRATIGMRLPVHCTALGKCLLAQLPNAAARTAAGPEPYRALTERTLARWTELQRQLDEIRRGKPAWSRDEFERGLSSVAVPVRWDAGEGPAAINVSLPSPRATVAARRELAGSLRATAAAIESVGSLGAGLASGAA
jgi:IclR family acetate operon transcriptional repressor